MIRLPRTAAVATIAALGASVATPALTVASAATPTLPSTSSLTAALEQLGVPSADVSSVLSDLTSLQSAGGSSASILTLDNELGSTISSVTSGLLSVVTNLLATPGQSLESTIATLQSGLPASAGLSELIASLQTSGLSSVLSGLTTDNGAGVLSALSSLQSLAPGASTGDLSAVTAVLTKAAGLSGISGTSAATTLTSIASALGSGSLTPAQLESVITQLQSLPSNVSLPGGTSAINLQQLGSALASGLSQSGSLLGALSTVGSGLSSGQVTSALSALGSLSSLAPGASTPSLSSLSSVLNAIAAAPGVSGLPAASTLTTLASALNGATSLSPTQLENTISTLNGLSGLPAPVSTLVSQLTSALSGSGSVFGNVPGLSAANATSALSELGTLSSLTPSSSIGALPGISAVLAALSQESGVVGTTLGNDLVALSAQLGTSQLTGPLLTELGEVLTKLSGSAPAAAQPVLSGLGSTLTTDGQKVAATTSSTTSSTSSTVSSTIGSITGTATKTTKAAAYAWGIVEKSGRASNKVTVTLYCLASKGEKCSSTVRMTGKGLHSWSKTIKLAPGKSDKVAVTLKQAGKKTTKKAKRVPIKVVVKSGKYSKTLTLK